ncbi:MAG: YafY family transcriptional regulator [Pseudomonadales bacterium]|nr:YafY family transcriptional regulator [Pseudomonadales bacterium]
MAQSTTRILAVLELLQSHGRLSGADLALRLNLDRRTLRRYIAALEDLGIPIMSERGRYGGYSLMPGFKLPPMMFEDNEAMALSLGLLAAQQCGLVQSDSAFASARSKLERVMPEPLRKKVRAIHHAITIDVAKSTVTAANNSTVLELSCAAANQQQVSIQYRSAAAIGSSRIVDPYGVAFYLGRYYLVAYCQLRNDIRTFTVERIVQLQTLATNFNDPETLDIISHIKKSLANIPREHYVEVLLDTDLATAQSYLSKTLGELSQVDSGVLLKHRCSDLGWFARELAHWPFNFKVHRPSQLHVELKLLAARLINA